jgi:DNA-binding PadR family transcriptional regulator
VGEKQSINGSVRTITEIAILSLLVERDTYVAQIVEKLRLNQQTLYSAIKKMENKKFVRSYWREGAVGGRCHMYSITGFGREYYEKNKTEIDYSLLSESHKKQKENKERQIYIPPEFPQEVGEAKAKEYAKYLSADNVFNLPLQKRNKKEAEAILNGTAPTAAPASPVIPATSMSTAPVTPAAATLPYILPTETIISTNKQQQLKITLSGTQSVDIRPLLKPNSVKTNCGFSLFNRLRLAAAVITALLVFSAYIVMYVMSHKIPPDATENAYFTIAFIALAIYITVQFAVWLILPQYKKEIRPLKFIGMRAAVSAVALAVVWSIYLIATPQFSSMGNIILGIVPSVFAAIPVLEGLILLILRRVRFFVC